MAEQTSGLAFKLFYNDPKYWPSNSGIYHDDVVFLVNGEQLSEGHAPETAADTDVVTIEGGVVLNSPLYSDKDAPSLEGYFKRWQREQTTETFVVTCDKALVEAVKAAVEAAGGEVSK